MLVSDTPFGSSARTAGMTRAQSTSPFVTSTSCCLCASMAALVVTRGGVPALLLAGRRHVGRGGVQLVGGRGGLLLHLEVPEAHGDDNGEDGQGGRCGGRNAPHGRR